MMAERTALCGLHFITVNDPSRGRGHVAVARAALEGGAQVIQLRDKNATTRQLLAWADEIRVLTSQAGALFLVNDRLDVALAAGADGVHLGQDDMPIDAARKIAGKKMIIGISATNLAEAIAADAAGADYLGVGPIFATPSKDDAAPTIGLEGLRQMRAAITAPLIAIGGVSAINASQILAAGADGLAVISAIAGADDMVAATRNLVESVKAFSVQRSAFSGN
jgi:thiamine-phosphate pyrophosphorylase